MPLRRCMEASQSHDRFSSRSAYGVASDLRFVLLIPDFEVSTPDARKVMPKSISVADAAANAADARCDRRSLCTKRYELLRGAFGDRLHSALPTPSLSPSCRGDRAAKRQVPSEDG